MSLKFFCSSDFWGYTEVGHYYFESREGDMLFGDRLPSLTPEGEQEARQILRAANIAHRHATDRTKGKIVAALRGLTGPEVYLQ